MILVTVGTHPQGFERLVRAADELAGRTPEEVVIQYGSSTYIPQHAARRFAFTDSREMEQLTARAWAVITHAAAGALILGLRLGKPLVLVPRLRRYGEVVDDHQSQLAKALEADGRAIWVQELSAEALMEALRRAESLRPSAEGAGRLIAFLQGQLRGWQER